MAKCKCGNRPRIRSNAVQAMHKKGKKCCDVCTSPACGNPKMLSIFAPVIYDEIGINLCTMVELGVDIPATYSTVTSATIRVIDANFEYGTEGVTIEPIAGRPNCYLITLTDINIRFAVQLYDAACRLVTTLYPEALFLPSNTEAETYDEDTNPSSVELEIFAPYGISYEEEGGNFIPIINYIGFTQMNDMIRQGINLYSFAKLLEFDIDSSTITAGLTLVLQSAYFTGYKIESAGKVEIPKGSIIQSENSECLRFVAGDLLNLEIKPLDLGAPYFDECNKKSCKKKESACSECCKQDESEEDENTGCCAHRDKCNYGRTREIGRNGFGANGGFTNCLQSEDAFEETATYQERCECNRGQEGGSQYQNGCCHNGGRKCN